MRLIDHVREALTNACENGYPFDGWTNSEIAADMIAYDDYLSAFDELDIVKALETIAVIDPKIKEITERTLS